MNHDRKERTMKTTTVKREPRPDWNDRTRSYINGARLIRVRIREAHARR